MSAPLIPICQECMTVLDAHGRCPDCRVTSNKHCDKCGKEQVHKGRHEQRCTVCGYKGYDRIEV